MPQQTMPTRSGGAVRNAPQNDEEDVDTAGDGAEDRSGSAEDRLSARDKLFEAIDAKRNAAVQADVDYAFATGDPAAAQAEAERRANQSKSTEEDAAASARKAAPADKSSNGTAAGSRRQDVSETPSEADGGGEVSDDDTAAVNLPPEVVLRAGKAHLKLKVDGREQFVPLDTAIAQLQKGGAAEVRLQQAAELRKQLDARATELDAREASISVR